MIKIYHNPRCSKSRQTLQLIQEKGIDPEVILYLEKGFSKDELKDILAKLGKNSFDILRSGEDKYKQLLKENGKASEDVLLDWMVDNPILVERPIVINGDKARLGRPPESVLEII